MERIKFYLIISLIVILSLVLIPGCQTNYPEISLEPPDDVDLKTVPTPHYHPESEPSFTNEKSPLRLAIAPVLSPPKTRESYRKLLSYLPQKLERPVELVIRSTYAEINQLIEQDQVDVALIDGASYVTLEEQGQVDLLVAPQINGQTSYHSYIIASAESYIQRMEDLRGERFVFTDPLSFTGRLYVLDQLGQKGETAESFFADTYYSYSNDNSIIAVAEGWIKAAAVDSLVYDYLLEENLDLQDNITIIESSPLIGNPPVVVNTNVDTELRKQMKDILLLMHTDLEGQKALTEMRVDRFVRAEDEDYELLRKIITEKEVRLD